MDSAHDQEPRRRSVPPVGRVSGAREPGQSLLDPLERVFASLRRMASDYATLAVVDLRRATIQLAWLVGSGILIAVLLVTAWLAGLVALGVLLLGNGMSWPSVLGLAALLNLIGALIVVWSVKHVFDEAPFAAVLKQIKSPGADTNEPRAA